jgi:hypothetical protein
MTRPLDDADPEMIRRAARRNHVKRHGLKDGEKTFDVSVTETFMAVHVTISGVAGDETYCRVRDAVQKLVSDLIDEKVVEINAEGDDEDGATA